VRYGLPPAVPAQLPVVEGVTLGSTVSLNPDVWRRHEGESWFGLDRADLRITAQGYIELDAMTHIHRFYTDEEIMLQVGSGAALGGPGDDFTVFHGLWHQQPASEYDRRSFLDQLRREQFRWQDATYERFWYGGGYDGDQDPVTLSEAVYEDRSGRPTRHVSQTCMLYCRPLPAGGQELLLALETMPEHGAPTQELMVGLPLTSADLYA
jgi:hypothetical protein